MFWSSRTEAAVSQLLPSPLGSTRLRASAKAADRAPLSVANTGCSETICEDWHQWQPATVSQKHMYSIRVTSHYQNNEIIKERQKEGKTEGKKDRKKERQKERQKEGTTERRNDRKRERKTNRRKDKHLYHSHSLILKSI